MTFSDQCRQAEKSSNLTIYEGSLLVLKNTYYGGILL
jgi:hypothetical protein